LPNSPADCRLPARTVLRLEIPASIDAFERARLALLASVAHLGLARRIVFKLELVLEETLMNLLRHAYADRAGQPIVLTVGADADAVVLQFEDEGPPFDPRQVPPPVRPTSIQEAVPGGLGLMLTRKAASSLVYERRGARNCLTLRIDREASRAPIGGLNPAT
jgi:serine/threonine-protein kinase RsbW